MDAFTLYRLVHDGAAFLAYVNSHVPHGADPGSAFHAVVATTLYGWRQSVILLIVQKIAEASCYVH